MIQMANVATRTSSILKVEKLVNRLLSEHKNTYEVWLSQRFDKAKSSVSGKNSNRKPNKKSNTAQANATKI